MPIPPAILGAIHGERYHRGLMAALRVPTNIVGRAARYQIPFDYDPRVHNGPRHMFGRGCFRDAHTRYVVLGINHEVCRCKYPGRSWKTEGDYAVIDQRLVLASTRAWTLQLGEDAAGLWFKAYVRPDTYVQAGDGPPINVLAALTYGQIGVSVHGHGGERFAEPVDVLVWARQNLIELSLCLPPTEPATCPGTWAEPLTESSLRKLHDEALVSAGA